MLASAAMTADGQHHLALLDPNTGTRTLVALPGRAHGILSLPGNRLLAVARRPDRFAAVIDTAQGRVERVLQAGPGRHFYGHAVASPDGRYLFTSENDYDGRRGVIGVRTIGGNWKQVAELPSHGVGPHEIALAADGASLIVANGGIATHPDEGRRKLNLDSMRPSMARIALGDGALLDSAALPSDLSRLSLRHIDMRADGLVVVAGQYQGEATGETPLLATWQPGEGLRILPTTPELAPAIHGYCASVKFDASGRFIAVSAPRGGLVAFWSLAPARFLGQLPLRDGAGIAGLDAGRFLLSSGTGSLITVDLQNGGNPTEIARERLPWHWDNHLTRV